MLRKLRALLCHDKLVGTVAVSAVPKAGPDHWAEAPVKDR